MSDIPQDPQEPAAAPPGRPAHSTLITCLSAAFAVTLVVMGTVLLAWKALNQHWWDAPEKNGRVQYYQAQANGDYKRGTDALLYGRSAEGLKHLRSALDLYKKDRSFHQAVQVLNDLAWEDNKQDRKLARAEFEEALAVLKAHPSPALEAHAQWGLACNLLMESRGVNARARLHLERARTLYLGFKRAKVVAYIDRDLMYQEMNRFKFDRALAYAVEAAGHFHECGMFAEEKQALRMAESFQKKGAREADLSQPYHDDADPFLDLLSRVIRLIAR